MFAKQVKGRAAVDAGRGGQGTAVAVTFPDPRPERRRAGLTGPGRPAHARTAKLGYDGWSTTSHQLEHNFAPEAPEGCVEVIDRDARGRAVYRLHDGFMVALAHPP